MFIVPSPVPGMPYPDVTAMFASVCYKYLETVADQPFALASDADLNAFYNRVDQSKHCSDSVLRHTFDFTAQRIVGTVVAGNGCGIDLTYVGTQADQAITFRKTLQGDCPYGLVRQIWLAVPREGNLTLSITSTP
jgi:hypothetical protein